MIRRSLRIILCAFICSCFLPLCCCSSQKEEKVATGFRELLNRIGEMDIVTEAEAYNYYILRENSSIEEVVSLIDNAIVKEIEPKKDDFVYLYEGAPTDASWLCFEGSESELNVYVNDENMHYDLVCCLVSSYAEREWYCYSLDRELYLEIKKIMHKGEKENLVD